MTFDTDDLVDGAVPSSVFPFSSFLPRWQLASITSILAVIGVWSELGLTHRLRDRLRPKVLRMVQDGVQTVLAVQAYQHPRLTVLMSAVSILVSVEFYISFLPFLFWVGEGTLALLLTLLMAGSMYAGNVVKDIVCAPRPPSPPVVRLTQTSSDKEHALEYGLPSSHTFNIILMLGYLEYYLLANGLMALYSPAFFASILALSIILALVVFGRLYLGMHSPIDVYVGAALAAVVLPVWCNVDRHVVDWISWGTNVIPFHALLTVLLMLAYPTPEETTPSYEYHTAFNGVAFGVIAGYHRMQHYHLGLSLQDLLPHTGLPATLARLAIGYPAIMIMKSVSKQAARHLLPLLASFIGISLRPSTPSRDHKGGAKKANKEETVLDLGPMARLVSYACVGWTVVEPVPMLCIHLGL